jgi:hypothetical protein
MLRLYPAAWRERYGEEFAAVLDSQRPSVGIVLDVLAGAVDAHVHPQIHSSRSKSLPGEDTMTLAMLQRCAVGGPKLSPQDRRAAEKSMIISSLIMAALYMALTKIYRSALPVQAFGYAFVPFLGLIYERTAYLRKRSRLSQVVLMAAGFMALYLFMLVVCLLAAKL